MTGAGMAGLTYFASNDDDPYITMKNFVSYSTHHSFKLSVKGRPLKLFEFLWRK